MPWGHITGVRKKNSRVIATSRAPHTAFSYGVHITETTVRPFTDMFLIIYFFTFCLSCSFYFCDITSLYEKPGRKGEAEPTCQKPWEAFFTLRQEFATFYSIQFLMMKRITPPPSRASEFCLFGLCICTPPSTASSNSFRDINKQINDVLSLGTHYLMPGGKKKGC